MERADSLRVPDAPRPGDEVGAYRLKEELGAGGMGRVFLAEHQKLGRRVALKVLQPELWHNRRSVQRFFQEARLVNRIDHENIVEIYDYVQEPDGLSYLIMELLVGHDLTQSREQQGPFALARAVPILRQIAAALAAAHAEGVVHRDLKPGNVFLVQKGSRRDFVKLLDFGIAKLQDSVDIEAPRTRTGAIVGTPLYMSPEQASGEKVDARSDLYSLGVVAYWLIADTFPYKAKSFAELLQKQHNQPAEALPAVTAMGDPVPPELARIVRRCLERDAGARFQRAAELEAALAPLVPEGAGAGSGAGSGTDVGRARVRAPTPLSPPAAAAPAPNLAGPTVVMSPPPAPAPRRSRSLWPAAAVLVGMGAAAGTYVALQPAATRAALPAAPRSPSPPLAVTPPEPEPAAPAATARPEPPPAEPTAARTLEREEPAPVPTAARPAPRAPEKRAPTAATPGVAAGHKAHERPHAEKPEHKATGKRPAAPTPSGDDDVLDPFGK